MIILLTVVWISAIPYYMYAFSTEQVVFPPFNIIFCNRFKAPDVSTCGGGHEAPGNSMNGILLFNPRSANAKYRVPNS
ncbi:MAG TPA: hypothetical protein VGI38_01380, partial [Puia sp.]